MLLKRKYRESIVFLWPFCPRKEKWAVNTKPHCVQLSLSPYTHTDTSKPYASLSHMFLFRSHIFHCSSPKGSHNITWKLVVISLLFLWGLYHNTERPRQACNLQDFASFSCMLSFLKTFGKKSSIPADTIYTRKIFFVAGLRWRRRGQWESRCCIRLETSEA